MDVSKVKIFKTQIAIPVPKGGSGHGAEPQQLLMSSAVACYTMTLAYMLDRSKLPVSGFYMDTVGSVSTGDQLGIVHYPHVVLSEKATNEDVAKAEELIWLADEQCHIGQLLIKAGVPVKAEGKVSVDLGDEATKQYIDTHGLNW
ncbi:OsmC-like protein [compost metagenome]